MSNINNINNMSITVTAEEYENYDNIDLDIDFEKIIKTSSNTLQRQYRSMYITFHDYTNVFCDKGKYAAVSTEGSGDSKWYWYHSLDGRYLFVIAGTYGWSYYEGMPRADQIVDFERQNIINMYIERDDRMFGRRDINRHLELSLKKLRRYFKMDDKLLCSLNDATTNKEFYELLTEEHLVILGH